MFNIKWIQHRNGLTKRRKWTMLKDCHLIKWFYFRFLLLEKKWICVIKSTQKSNSIHEWNGWMNEWTRERKIAWKRKEITDIQGIHSHLKIEQIQFGLQQMTLVQIHLNILIIVSCWLYIRPPVCFCLFGQRLQSESFIFILI